MHNRLLEVLVMMLAFGLPQEPALAVGNDKAPAREEEITTIVIHAIGGPICKGNKVIFTAAPGDSRRWKKWFEKQKSISIHYIVDRDGNVEQSINEEKVAWHTNGLNNNSIGIELVNRGDGMEEYPAKQVSSLIALVNEIIGRHKGIRKEKVVRHSDVDHRKFECGGQQIDKKQDPGPKFPYDYFISKLITDRKLINHARSRNGGGIAPTLFH